MGNKKSKHVEVPSCPYCEEISTPSSILSYNEDRDGPNDIDEINDLHEIFIPGSETDPYTRSKLYRKVKRFAAWRSNMTECEDLDDEGIEAWEMKGAVQYTMRVPQNTCKDNIKVDIIKDKGSKKVGLLDIKVVNDGKTIHRQEKISHEGKCCYAEYRDGLISVVVLVKKWNE